MSFDEIWAVPDAAVASGRIPGYVAAVRVRGHVEIHAAGRTAIEAGSPPMRTNTLFRIASVTKPIGGVLTLSLVEDGVIALDDEVARWAPELASPRVLRAADGPLDDTVPAVRPVTVRHLLTLTSGWGVGLESSPLITAMMERGVFASPMGHTIGADEFIARVGQLPLVFQPGEGWRYETSMNLLGIVLERATGRTLSELLAERVFGPLGLADTAFAAVDPARMAAAYRPGDDGALELTDPPDGRFARPPGFEQLSGGLVSTAGDILRFCNAIADGELLSDASRAAFSADALTPQQRATASDAFLPPGASWGLGTGVITETGAWGWTGGTGTTASVDPSHDTVAVLLTQRAMAGPDDSPEDFYGAVEAAAQRPLS
ncbi:beta-lactamase family protein [Solirubrobacter sp. CPCC 204708]|uniref:Beta-lactamase family protein n=1 Tax=Solirubrobacter deserti TaxID=2282478 RepID=A0ABT4RK41_9ACTN|nr:serine hydrolase domain-containing protein [Solirubrobacter deserti]MBE2316861.1 beta-lactamase family protein [Solirubrobacter deserti]MDA0138922.1 beta-lactamase family protein [Solirubrobacter deserti]